MSEDFRVTAARLARYAHDDGPCRCGQRRGHAGWLICALGPESGQHAAGTTTVSLNTTATTADLCPDPEEDDAFWIDGRPIIGRCSVCGEAREDNYTCRKDGTTVPYDTTNEAFGV